MRETLDEVVTPIIFTEALDLIEEHQAAGRQGRDRVVSARRGRRPLGEFLGVDDVIATRAEVDDDGDYTGELAFYGYGPHKAEAIRGMAGREGLDLAASYAYSDSVTDEPMLRAVGHPVAVNPDRELARVARDEEWPVLTSCDRCGCATGCRCRQARRIAVAGRLPPRGAGRGVVVAPTPPGARRRRPSTRIAA